MDITLIKEKIKQLTKKLGNNFKAPSLVVLDGSEGVAELKFDDAFDRLTAEMQENILTYYSHGLDKFNIREVKVFSIDV